MSPRTATSTWDASCCKRFHTQRTSMFFTQWLTLSLYLTTLVRPALTLCDDSAPPEPDAPPGWSFDRARLPRDTTTMPTMAKTDKAPAATVPGLEICDCTIRWKRNGNEGEHDPPIAVPYIILVFSVRRHQVVSHRGVLYVKKPTFVGEYKTHNPREHLTLEVASTVGVCISCPRHINATVKIYSTLRRIRKTAPLGQQWLADPSEARHLWAPVL